jgi:hypothetical protein
MLPSTLAISSSTVSSASISPKVGGGVRFWRTSMRLAIACPPSSTPFSAPITPSAFVAPETTWPAPPPPAPANVSAPTTLPPNSPVWYDDLPSMPIALPSSFETSS